MKNHDRGYKIAKKCRRRQNHRWLLSGNILLSRVFLEKLSKKVVNRGRQNSWKKIARIFDWLQSRKCHKEPQNTHIHCFIFSIHSAFRIPFFFSIFKYKESRSHHNYLEFHWKRITSFDAASWWIVQLQMQSILDCRHSIRYDFYVLFFRF